MPYLEKTCFVLDMDGTVYLGDNPIPGAVAFIRERWTDVDFYFLSNNTSKGLESYVAKLRRMGIPADLSRLLSPTTPMVEFLRENRITRAYLVGNADYAATLQAAMPELELMPQTTAAQGAQAVILSYDTELNYEKLRTSALLLHNPETRFLATHPDLVCPSPEGPLPDVGSFISLYATATGRTPSHIFGKPNPHILSPLLSRYPLEAMAMVGDRLSTDKALADRTGMDFVLVLSGEATRADLKQEATQPWRVVEDLGQLR